MVVIDCSMDALITARVNPIKPSYDRRGRSSTSLRLADLGSRRSFTCSSRSIKSSAIIPSSLPQSNSLSTAQFDNTLPSKEVLEIWQSADAVCFDVDSTVCLDEGIDELADFCGAGKAVAEWTAKLSDVFFFCIYTLILLVSWVLRDCCMGIFLNTCRAMSGSVPFEEALAARLSLFNPSLSQVHDFLVKRPPRITPGIAELIQRLKLNNSDVYLISGGFRQMIKPVALQLGIPPENIFANQLLFGDSGDFLGFDATEPTSRSGGKATAVQNIRKVHGYKALIMIGDGATDLEARMPGGADLFICYAGVQLRDGVAAKADWLVFDFQELLTSLP